MASQIYNTLGNNSYLVREPNLTYSLQYDGKTSSLDAMEQAIFAILMTERYSNPIYDDDYGVELEQYIGKDIGFIRATIENTLSDALTYDDRITGVNVTSVERNKKDPSSCTIYFTVNTIHGDFEESINVAT